MIRRLDAGLDGALFKLILFVNHQNGYAVLSTCEGLDRNGQGISLIIEDQGSARVHTWNQLACRIGNVHFRVHGSRGGIHLICKSRHLALDLLSQRRDPHFHGTSQADLGDGGFRDGNDQAQEVYLGQRHEWH